MASKMTVGKCIDYMAILLTYPDLDEEQIDAYCRDLRTAPDQYLWAAAKKIRGTREKPVLPTPGEWRRVADEMEFDHTRNLRTDRLLAEKNEQQTPEQKEKVRKLLRETMEKMKTTEGDMKDG